MSRPLRELAGKTAAIDLDRLDVDFASERTDEIGALSRLLGAMTARLRSGAARLREAERRIAMGDLARQVNHDIKNGLVPIRNVLRHLDEVARDRPEALGTIFEERRGTLESSVGYLDTLARNYARLSPAAAPEQCDVNAMVSEVVRASAAGATVRTRLADRTPAGRRGPADAAADPGEPGGQRGRQRLVGGRRGGGLDRARHPRRHGARRPDHRGRHRAGHDAAPSSIAPSTTSTPPRPGGTGLGLSIVRRLVLDLGGALRVETEPGAGTRATVEIPAAPAGGGAG